MNGSKQMSAFCAFCENQFAMNNKCVQQEWIEYDHLICGGLSMTDYLHFQHQSQNDKTNQTFKCLICTKEP